MLLPTSTATMKFLQKLGQKQWWSTLQRGHARLVAIMFAAQMYATKGVWANEGFVECTIGTGAGKWIRRRE